MLAHPVAGGRVVENHDRAGVRRTLAAAARAGDRYFPPVDELAFHRFPWSSGGRCRLGVIRSISDGRSTSRRRRRKRRGRKGGEQWSGAERRGGGSELRLRGLPSADEGLGRRLRCRGDLDGGRAVPTRNDEFGVVEVGGVLSDSGRSGDGIGRNRIG